MPACVAASSRTVAVQLPDGYFGLWAKGTEASVGQYPAHEPFSPQSDRQGSEAVSPPARGAQAYAAPGAGDSSLPSQ
jgi:hypothetical protein